MCQCKRENNVFVRKFEKQSDTWPALGSSALKLISLGRKQWAAVVGSLCTGAGLSVNLCVLCDKAVAVLSKLNFQFSHFNLFPSSCTSLCLCPSGEVFHSSVPGRLSLSSASDRCVSLGGQLATVGQLYLAWQGGLDSCAPGWLSDGSVRYPVTQLRPECAAKRPGVHTVPSNITVDNSTALFDAYCYRGASFMIALKWVLHFVI